MNFQFLDTFLMVAEVKNFTKAAEKLHISQPTVSWQIKELERELGVPLFEREGKEIWLSEGGLRFLPMARCISAEWENAVRTMAEMNDVNKLIKIGCPEVIAISLISDVIKELCEQFKDFSLEVSTGVFSDFIKKLKRRELDYIYIFNERMVLEGLEKLLEREEEVIFVCAPTHLLEKKKYVLRDLENYTFIVPLRDEVTSYVHRIQEYFENASIHVPSMLKIGSVVVCKEMAINNVGVSILPEFYVQKELKNGSLVKVEIEDVRITMWSQFFCVKGRWMSRADKIFLDKIEQKLMIN